MCASGSDGDRCGIPSRRLRPSGPRRPGPGGAHHWTNDLDQVGAVWWPLVGDGSPVAAEASQSRRGSGASSPGRRRPSPGRRAGGPARRRRRPRVGPDGWFRLPSQLPAIRRLRLEPEDRGCTEEQQDEEDAWAQQQPRHSLHGPELRRSTADGVSELRHETARSSGGRSAVVRLRTIEPPAQCRRYGWRWASSCPPVVARSRGRRAGSGAARRGGPRAARSGPKGRLEDVWKVLTVPVTCPCPVSGPPRQIAIRTCVTLLPVYG